MEVVHPRLLLSGRRRRSVVHSGTRLQTPPHSRIKTLPRHPFPRHRLSRRRPGTSVAVREHVARVPADVADEHGLVVARGVRPAAGASAVLGSSLGAGVAGVAGVPLAGYTGVLVASTAVPAWQDASASLPALFTASGGRRGVAADAGPVRRRSGRGAAPLRHRRQGGRVGRRPPQWSARSRTARRTRRPRSGVCRIS